MCRLHVSHDVGSYQCLTRCYREAGETTRARDYLPADKQYLITRGVPCLRRATSLAYNEDERLLSFGELSAKKGEDEWVETHSGRPHAGEDGEERVIDEIPDADEHDELSHGMSGLSVSSANVTGAGEIPDMDEIPDMEEDDLEGEDDAAVAAPKKATTSGLVDARYVTLYTTYKSDGPHPM